MLKPIHPPSLSLYIFALKTGALRHDGTFDESNFASGGSGKSSSDNFDDDEDASPLAAGATGAVSHPNDAIVGRGEAPAHR